MAARLGVLPIKTPRPLRIKFPGVIYHLINRGDRREPIFRDDLDRHSFLATFGEACAMIR